ncbi:hypothetical protein [Pseudofrankia sp. DC12]|uniref:hypothetical protein n=1 Tax=Pseudofrankia sp. DC12 TaxID=683315 RepID=UPI0005F831C4|nr:hypothetical protein [Pseudofrankia sp. DC12]
MTGARRGWLIVALALVVLALVASVAAVVSGVGRTTTGAGRPGQYVTGTGAGGYGPGMMGGPGAGAGEYGPGMMGGSGPGSLGPGMMLGAAGSWQGGGRSGLAGDGQAVTSMAAAKARAQAFADRLGGGRRAGEVMQFSNGYYSELLASSGQGATEVLIDPASGAVSIEHGPALMWNTGYGMRAAGDVTARVSAAEAVKDAQAWLDAQHTGLTAGEAMAFPGYYTMHTLSGGKIVGMMSVNAVTGAAWYHTWHGTFIAMVGK